MKIDSIRKMTVPEIEAAYAQARARRDGKTQTRLCVVADEKRVRLPDRPERVKRRRR